MLGPGNRMRPPDDLAFNRIKVGLIGCIHRQHVCIRDNGNSGGGIVVSYAFFPTIWVDTILLA